MDNIDRTFYCNQKFWWLSVDLQKSTMQSCCSASPHKIDFEHIRNNPGQLFNSLELVTERTAMLKGIAVKSCHATCWQPESEEKISRRVMFKGYEVTHISLRSEPEVLNIMLGNDCNMACVYCCKNYSSTWAHDIINGGNYQITTQDDRFTLTDRDRVRLRVSQKDIRLSQQRQELIDEIGRLSNTPKLKNVMISGGEPFLHIDLAELVQPLPDGIDLEIWTGLGVDPSRFRRELAKITAIRKIKLVVSAENTGALYEINRNGNTWSQFLENIQTIRDQNVEFSYNAVLSNTTAPGILAFIVFATGTQINWNVCNDPDFLAPHVLDPETKQSILDSLDAMSDGGAAFYIRKALEIEPDDETINRFRTFFNEFCRRRNLSLEAYPETFKNWITNVV